ncbi:glycosyltransferase [Furfurilactobacillus cerevisiae]|uniref:glycosyltransferase n=1 Tax=Furfurilactobacillus rossiae TaxID=231049 RepID=UPI003B9854F3
MKVLVNGGNDGMSTGSGITEFVLQNYSRINNGEVQFHFLLDGSENNSAEFMNQHNMSYTLLPSFHEEPLTALREWQRYLNIEMKNFDAIHFHVDSLLRAFKFHEAKRAGAKRIIVQSHNSAHDNGLVRKSVSGIGRMITKHDVTDYLTCSNLAANIYPSSVKVTLIKNGIDTQHFAFNEKTRKRMRQEFDIDSETNVYLHVGRINRVKNQSFVLDVFKKILVTDTTAKLILVGRGEDEEKIVEKIKNDDLTDHVLMLGFREDVAEIMSAADCVIFPSLHEGLPYVLIEAQANGLPIVCANTVTDEVSISKLVTFLDLAVSVDEWANTASRLVKHFSMTKRSDFNAVVRSKGYDIAESSMDLYNYYLNMNKQEV